MRLFKDKKLSLCPMRELSLHIERLLLQHDCVVVPHFGAFVARDTVATHSGQEDIFFPPSRLVRFNPDIIQDDNLLVAAVSMERQCSVPDAKRAIQGMVLNLRQQLLADGQVDFGTIGVFMQDDDGVLSFSSCQAGVTTPRYYGLDAFTMPRLAAINHQPSTISHQPSRTRSIRRNDDITIRISRRSLRNVAAAAAIALLCVLFSNPFQLGDVNGGKASVLPTETSVTPKESPKPTANSSTLTEETSTLTANRSTLTEQTSTLTEEPSTATNFAIVLASNVSRKNADAFVERLHEQGYTQARVHDNGRMLRVVIDGIASEAEANTLAHQMHTLGGDYAQAWVMQL